MNDGSLIVVMLLDNYIHKSMLFFVVILSLVIAGGGLYLLYYFTRRQRYYMSIEQLRELINQPKQHNINNDDNTIVDDMFTQCPCYKSNHVTSNLDYIQLYNYIRLFCCEKSLYTNRPGPVCPFLPRSLKEQCIYFFDDIYSTNKWQLIQTIQQCRHDFLSILKPTAFRGNNLVVHKCLIILIRSSSISHRLIDQIQVELKPEFILKHGLLLGEFHSSSNSPSIKNKDFYPLRTKVPLLVIRYLVANDILFLNQKHKHPKDVRVKLINAYLDLHKKGSLHSAKDYHLCMAYDILNELNDCRGLDN